MPADRRAGWLPTHTDLQIVGWTLLLKMALLGFGMGVVVLFGSVVRPDVPGGSSTDSRPVFEAWSRWDAPHYTDIAAFGYQAIGTDSVGPGGYRSAQPDALPTYIVFYPLYPWLVGVLNLFGDPVLAALLVSGIASLLVGPLLYRLVAIELGPAVGRRSVLFLLLFPTAYFLHIGYTESLFLALALGSLLAARTDRWWLAGALGALATLTRVNGLILVPALAVEALLQWWPDRKWRWRWLAIGLVPLGFAAYVGLNVAVYGDPGAFLRIEADVWHKTLSPPWVGISNLVNSTLPRAWIPELAFVALGLVATIATARRFRPSWTVWMAGNWLLFTSTSFVLSVPRYSLLLFPIFVWFAVLAQSVRATILITGLSTLGLIFFAGRFALGLWAF